MFIDYCVHCAFGVCRRQKQIGMNPQLHMAGGTTEEVTCNQGDESATNIVGDQERDEKERERRDRLEAQLLELQVWCAQLLRSVIACKEALQDQDNEGRERQLLELQVWNVHWSQICIFFGVILQFQ